jgi:hypothetical protein
MVVSGAASDPEVAEWMVRDLAMACSCGGDLRDREWLVAVIGSAAVD